MLRSLLAACLLCGAATALAADDASNPDTEIWRKVRARSVCRRIVPGHGASPPGRKMAAAAGSSTAAFAAMQRAPSG